MNCPLISKRKRRLFRPAVFEIGECTEIYCQWYDLVYERCCIKAAVMELEGIKDWLGNIAESLNNRSGD